MFHRVRNVMAKSFTVTVAVIMVASNAGFASPARAATITITANDATTASCSTAIPGGTHCFFVNNTVTASKSGGSVTATNVVTASVGDTIVLQNQSGNHNVIFCKAGTIVNGWNCGDPISTGGPEPGAQSASTAGAPAMITTGSPIGDGGMVSYAAGYSTTLDAPGTFFFWCGIGSHRFGGQYGKLEVTGSAQAVPGTTNTSGTAAPVTTTAREQVTPTLTVKRSGARITASGRATAGARVTLQRLAGTKWVRVGSTIASAGGSYTLRVKAESKRTSYRVLVGTAASATKRA